MKPRLPAMLPSRATVSGVDAARDGFLEPLASRAPFGRRAPRRAEHGSGRGRDGAMGHAEPEDGSGHQFGEVGSDRGIARMNADGSTGVSCWDVVIAENVAPASHRLPPFFEAARLDAP